jgi:hypothetical protein
MGVQGRGRLAAELSRRDFITRAGRLGAGALVAAPVPSVGLVAPSRARAAALPALGGVSIPDATLQASPAPSRRTRCGCTTTR